MKTALRGALRRIAPRRADLPLATWRLARNASGALALDGVDLEPLLERWGSPLHVVDAVRLAENAAGFRRAPGCDVFYSYKTNPVPGVLRILHGAGVGAEVVSEYELWLALELGVDPKNIIYNGPSKSQASLETAVTRGVGLVNLNDRSEIEPLVCAARRANKTATVGIRIAPPGTIGGQFGEQTDDGSALAAFAEAKRHPELRVVAMHAHFNDEIASLERTNAFLDPILAFTDTLRDRLGIELEILDVGGNLACPTVSRLTARDRRMAVTFGCDPVPHMSSLPIETYVEHVASRVRAHYGARTAPRIFFEPGRALTGNAQMLLCRVTSVQEHGDGLTWAVLDAGINVAEPLRNEFHQLFALRERDAPKRAHRLTGPSCTLGDQLYPAWTLPALSSGDGLAIMDSGAYFVPFATCFSRPRPAIAVIADGKAELVRRAETFDDLVRTDGGWRA